MMGGDVDASSKGFKKKIDFKISVVTDAHGLKIQRGGELKVLPKSLWGQGFQEKLPRGAVSSPLSPCVHLLLSIKL